MGNSLNRCQVFCICGSRDIYIFNETAKVELLLGSLLKEGGGGWERRGEEGGEGGGGGRLGGTSTPRFVHDFYGNSTQTPAEQRCKFSLLTCDSL